MRMYYRESSISLSNFWLLTYFHKQVALYVLMSNGKINWEWRYDIEVEEEKNIPKMYARFFLTLLLSSRQKHVVFCQINQCHGRCMPNKRFFFQLERLVMQVAREENVG